MPIERCKKGPRPSEFKVARHERAFDGFLRVDKVWAAQSAYRQDGETERFIETDRATEVMLRGDSVAAILYDPSKRAVVLVEQFRLPTAPMYRHRWVNGEPHQPVATGEPVRMTGGWIVETVAGSLRNRHESPEACMRREIVEEAGYRVTELREIATFFSSPGGTSEMIYLYFAEVTGTVAQSFPADDNAADGGPPAPTKLSGEDIDVLHVPIEEFFDSLEHGAYKDPKIIIGGYWLRDHLARTAQEVDGTVTTIKYRMKKRGQIVGIKTGNIKDVKGVEVWINPENTNMQMDRFFGRSVSAAIRWHGAEKTSDDKNKVKRDGIAEELRTKLGDRYHVGLGEVIETGSGALKASNGVRAIYHVAIAEGFAEQRLQAASLSTLRSSLTEVLKKIGYHNAHVLKRSYRSVLVPMIGTGTGGKPVREVAPTLVSTAVDFLEQHPESRLRELYFNAFSIDDRSHLKAAIDYFVEKGILEVLDDDKK